MGADEIVKVVFFRDLPYEVIYSDGRKRFVEKVVEEWKHPLCGQAPRDELKVEVAYRLIFGSISFEPKPASLRRYGAEPTDRWHLRFTD